MTVSNAAMPADTSDLVAALRWRAQNQSDRRGFGYVNGDDLTRVTQLSYSELDLIARAIGQTLVEGGAAGKPVLLLFPPGLDFVAGFWGCLYAGAIALPHALPEPRGSDSVLRRLKEIADDARPQCILTVAAAEAQLAGIFADLPTLRGLPRILCDRLDKGKAELWRAPTLGRDAIACLQYTSGSTGGAKGVMISHGNYLANSSRSADGSGFTEESTLVTWAPTSHSAGLMYGVCLPVCVGFPVVHMATQSFLEQPVRWLRAISHFQATHAGGPNFCYDLCVQRVTPDQWRELRLEHWQNAYSSGETVRAETLRRFAEAAAPSGFRKEAFQPCYGISESTMRVAESPMGRFPLVRVFDTRELERGRAVLNAQGEAEMATEIIGYGPLDRPGRKIRIVDPAMQTVCPDGEIGEVWIAGPDIASGYWNRPEESARTFRATIANDATQYLRTGDLGVAFEGELFLVGRLKELIIIRGVNHFPQDIELDVEQGARTAGVLHAAAFSRDMAGEEVLVVAAEVEETSFADADRVAAAIRDTVSRKHGLLVYDIAFIQSGALPRTVSGKLQRGLCRARYLAGELKVIAHSTRRLPGLTKRDEARTDSVRSRVRAALAQRVGLPEHEIGNRPFAEYGLDSMGAVSMMAELGQQLGRSLSPAILYDYPTVDALVRFLTEGAAEGTTEPGFSRRRGEVAVPVAIIGMSCRFPGGDGIENYWRVLHDGIDAVVDVPPSRWDGEALYDPEPGVPGKANTRSGGFIEGVDLFDRELFGMSERAAIDTDPQHRLLLEVAWEALEDAGIAPESLAGSATGVFLGISQSDYGRLTLSRVHDSSPFVSIGASPAVASNRLSYALDLHGPSVSIDTACSSSLVAVHQACRAIANGECDLAFAAGVNLLLTPERTIALSHGTYFSPDGKCKPFDASANGYARGEGVGVVLLKTLDQALLDQDRIYAVIRGSAVNQDGKTNGLTAPNGLAQQEVVRAALGDARMHPRDVDYVEAHGTGTALGDPIEVDALGAVFGADGPRHAPVIIGSVKSNIGHLESAAGIAGLIKAALCLQRRTLVPTLHVKQLNPLIRFSELPISVQLRTEPWNAEFPRVAGISAFGYGGTNAHVVIEEAPEIIDSANAGDAASEANRVVQPRQALVLSGASGKAVQQLADSFAAHLDKEPLHGEQLRNICFTAATARSHLEHRLAVTGATAEEMSRALRSYAEGGEYSGLCSGRVSPGSAPRVAFLFTGGGAQYVGMGQELYATQPIFRAAIDRCAAILADELEHPLTSVMFGECDNAGVINQIAYMQPVLFAFEYAMSELWRHWGIEPRLVIGHSLGELAAACVAGVFSLEDGLRLIAARGRLMQALPPGGEMLAVMASPEHAEKAIRAYPDELAIGVINGPENVVISGASSRIAETMEKLRAEGIRCKRLKIAGAGHSALMEPILDEFEAIASRIKFQAPRLAVISNVTGTVASADELCSPAYWRRHARETVRFADGVKALQASGCNILIEVGPNPTLLGMAREIVDDASLAWVPSIQKERGEWEQLLNSVGAVYVNGGPVDWGTFYRDSGHPRRVPLPPYPFQHERYWVANDGPAASIPSAAPTVSGHPFLGGKLGILGAFELGLERLPAFINEHVVFGKVVFPGVGFVETAFAAVREHWGQGACELRDVSLQKALVLDGDLQTLALHVEVLPEEGDVLQVRIFSGSRTAMEETAPIEHVRLEVHRTQAARDTVALDFLRTMCPEPLSPETHYQTLHKLGLHLGRSFQGLRKIWRGDNQAFAEIELDEALRNELGQYLVHPTMLDSGLQLSGVAQGAMHALAVPVGFERVSYIAAPGPRIFCHAVVRDRSGPSIKSDVRFFDEKGRLLVEIEGYVKQVVSPDALVGAATNWARWVWRQEWVKSATPVVSAQASGAKSHNWLILADDGLGPALAAQMSHAGDSCVFVTLSDEEPEEFEQRVVAGGHQHPFTDIVLCWPIGSGAVEEGRDLRDVLRANCSTALHLAQGVLKYLDEGGAAVRLWFVTSGAQPAEGSPVVVAHAPLWGFVRVLRNEHPELSCRLIDMPPQGSVDTHAISLASELSAASSREGDPFDAEVAIRAESRFVPRLVRYQPGEEILRAPVRPDATYLITGGLSGLGLATARWLVEQGARALVLLGRRGATDESTPVLQWMKVQGVKVLVLQADVSQAQDVARVLAETRQAMPPLRGVIHCAGLLVDRLLERQTLETFEEVFAPKVVGAWNLHLQTCGEALDFFVMYSSNSALVGLKGQSNYAAANAFLDALAHYRKAAGLAALSINWGPWAKIGLAVDAVADKTRLTIDPERGLQVLGGLLRSKLVTPQAVVPGTTSGNDKVAPKKLGGGGTLSGRLVGLPSSERMKALQEYIRECIAAVAGKVIEDVPYDRPVMDLGLNSLMTVELRQKLSSAMGGQRLSSTFILKHPTVAAMAEQLMRHFTEALGTEPAHGEDRPRKAEQTENAADNGHVKNGADYGNEEQAISFGTDAAAITPASNVISFSGNPSKVPLVLFHGIGGYAWAYLPLRQYIGDRPVILVNKLSVGNTLAEYVPLLVETLQSHQPRGPYILGGWSAGGRLAFEVASELERRGERVLGLLMFDVYRYSRMRRTLFSVSRFVMESKIGHAAVENMHPIARMLAIFGTGIGLGTAAELARLARMVMPHAPVPEQVSRAGLAETARWFLSQLAKGGRGLMLPDPTGEVTESLETVLTIRRIYQMTMGKIRIPAKLIAPAFTINVAGSAYTRGWSRYFANPVQEFEVPVNPVKGPRLTPFTRFSEHIALFDPEIVRLFGPQVADILSRIDGERQDGTVAPPQKEVKKGEETSILTPTKELE